MLQEDRVRRQPGKSERTEVEYEEKGRVGKGEVDKEGNKEAGKKIRKRNEEQGKQKMSENPSNSA